jgi:hypothetical protein
MTELLTILKTKAGTHPLCALIPLCAITWGIARLRMLAHEGADALAEQVRLAAEIDAHIEHRTLHLASLTRRCDDMSDPIEMPIDPPIDPETPPCEAPWRETHMP